MCNTLTGYPESLWAHERRPQGPTAYELAVIGVIMIVGTAVATIPAFLHWFVLPVTLLGILVGGDAVKWLRGRLDLFSPLGLFSVFGVYFFFLAPLLQIALGYRTLYTPAQPEDYRPWLGITAVLNLIGLALFRTCLNWCLRQQSRTPLRSHWSVDPPDFRFLLSGLMCASACAQAYVYFRFGGLSGYVHAFETTKDSFVGWGWLFVVSESFPVLLAMFILTSSQSQRWRGWQSVAALCLTVGLTAIVFGGLRGSRSNTVFQVVWAIGAFHLWIKKVSRPRIALMSAGIICFMYFYGFYKDFGSHAVNIVSSVEAQRVAVSKSHRDFLGMLLGDLGRADVQATLVKRSVDSALDLAWGRTYLGAIELLIPRQFWPERPPTKTKELTEAEYGKGTYREGVFFTSHVVGLAGEAVLNFGIIGIPLVFGVFGLFVGKAEAFYRALGPRDSRLLLMPWVSMFTCMGLSGDSDNHVFNVIKYLAIPMVVVGVGSTRVRQAAKGVGRRATGNLLSGRRLLVRASGHRPWT